MNKIKVNFMQCLLTCIILLFVICCSLVLFDPYVSLTAYDYYFLVTLVLLLIASFISWEYLDEVRTEFSISYLALIVIGIGIYFITRGQMYELRNIWLDEYMQFINMREDYWGNYSPARIAAFQQQPPLDYYLSAFSLNHFGLSRFSVRVFSIFGSLLTFILIPFVFRKHRLPIISSVICMGLILTDTWMTNLAVEGRPYSLGLLGSVFIIDSWIDLFKKRGWKNYVYFFCASFFAIISLGLQAPIIIFLLFISFGFSLMRKSKRDTLKLLFVCFCLFSFSFYYLYEIYVHSARQNLFNPDIIKSFLGYWGKLDLELYVIHWTRNAFVFYMFTLIFLYSFYSLFRKRAKYYYETMAIIVFNLLYPLIISAVCLVFIDWNYLDKYFICFRLITYITMSYLLGVHIKEWWEESFNLIKRDGECRVKFAQFKMGLFDTTIYSIDKKYLLNFFKIKYLLLLPIVFIYPNFVSNVYKNIEMPDKILMPNVDWKSFYGALNRTFNDEDEVLLLPLGFPEQWRNNIFVNGKIYGNSHRYLNYRWARTSEYSLPDVHKIIRMRGDKIFLAANFEGEIFLKDDFIFPAELKVKLLHYDSELILFELSIEGVSENERLGVVKKFLLFLLKNSLDKNYSQSLEEVIVLINYYQGDKKGALKVYQNLRRKVDLYLNKSEDRMFSNSYNNHLDALGKFIRGEKK